MFARLPSVFIALVAMIGAVAYVNADCIEQCCQSVGDASNGWQGSDCTDVADDGYCAYYKFCCYDVEGTSAAECTTPTPEPED